MMRNLGLLDVFVHHWYRPELSCQAWPFRNIEVGQTFHNMQRNNLEWNIMKMKSPFETKNCPDCLKKSDILVSLFFCETYVKIWNVTVSQHKIISLSLALYDSQLRSAILNSRPVYLTSSKIHLQ